MFSTEKLMTKFAQQHNSGFLSIQGFVHFLAQSLKHCPSL